MREQERALKEIYAGSFSRLKNSVPVSMDAEFMHLHIKIVKVSTARTLHLRFSAEHSHQSILYQLQSACNPSISFQKSQEKIFNLSKRTNYVTHSNYVENSVDTQHLR